jgi:hypothetical protein
MVMSRGNAERDADAEFAASRIPGSIRFDIDAVADRASPFPHMLPSRNVFAAAADAVPVVASDTVVIYDRIGTFSSPRAWWTWKVFGHKRYALCSSAGNLSMFKGRVARKEPGRIAGQLGRHHVMKGVVHECAPGGYALPNSTYATYASGCRRWHLQPFCVLCVAP